MKIQGYTASQQTSENEQDGQSEDLAAQIEKDLGNLYAHLLRGDARHAYMAERQAVANGQSKSEATQDKSGMFKSSDLEEVFDDFKRTKANEKEARNEVLKLQQFIRKQRLM